MHSTEILPKQSSDGANVINTSSLENQHNFLSPDSSKNIPVVYTIDSIKSHIESILGDLENLEISSVEEELEKLKTVKRFNGIGIEVLDSVHSHTERMLSMVIDDKIINYLATLNKNFDINYLLLLIIIHDLPENITLDIPSNLKRSLDFETLEKLSTIEKTYLKTLFKNTNFENYNIDDIIDDLKNKKSKESLFLKLIDLIDGFYYYYSNIYGQTGNKEPLFQYMSKEGKNIPYYILELKKQGIEIGNKSLNFTLIDPIFLEEILYKISTTDEYIDKFGIKDYFQDRSKFIKKQFNKLLSNNSNDLVLSTYSVVNNEK